jgi:hypothetical protein
MVCLFTPTWQCHSVLFVLLLHCMKYARRCEVGGGQDGLGGGLQIRSALIARKQELRTDSYRRIVHRLYVTDG